MARDDFTATVEGAAAYERLRAANEGHYDPRDERPSKADCDRDEAGSW